MIAFLPFATAFISENTDQGFPNIFYSGCLISVALLQIRLFARALRPIAVFVRLLGREGRPAHPAAGS